MDEILFASKRRAPHAAPVLDLFDGIAQRDSESSKEAAKRSSQNEHLAQQERIVMELATIPLGESRSMAELVEMMHGDLPINIVCLRLSKDELRAGDVEAIKGSRESLQIPGMAVMGFRLTEAGRRRAAALGERARVARADG